MELNPNHPMTKAVSNEWHKIVAIIMHKQNLKDVVISEKDIIAVEGMAVSIKEYYDGVYINLITMEEAKALAKEAGGLPI